MINAFSDVFPNQTLTYIQSTSFPTPVVIKDDMIKNPEECKRIQLERKLLLTVSHPNLLTYYSIVHLPRIDGLQVTSHIEYMDLLDLYTFIHGLSTPPPISFIRYALIQLLNGLQYIRTACKSILSSLTPYTILLSNDDSMPLPRIKISNFVHSISPFQPYYKLAFAAPELLWDLQWGTVNRHEKQDVWSLGMILYFIITGDHVFRKGDIIRELMEHKEIIFSNISNDELRELIARMLVYDENRRITFQELSNHNFIRASKLLIYSNEGSHQYKFIRVIGEGHFGKVYEAQELFGEKRIVALKEIKSTNDNQVLRESRIMRICNHPNLVKIYDYFTSPYPIFVTENDGDEELNGGNYHYIVMEKCDCDLLTYCKEHSLSENQILEIFKQLVQGLHYLLRGEKIFHRDLKLENFLLKREINGSVVVKISDYGLSKIVVEQSLFESCVGTPQYMAPEVSFVNLKGNYTINADMYSLGVCLYYLVSQRWPPIQNKDSLWICIDSNISNDLVFPDGFNKDFIYIIQQMLEIDVKKRISWDELFVHPFITQKLQCVFVDINQFFVKSLLPPPQTLINAQKIKISTPRVRHQRNDFSMEEDDDNDDFDKIIQCFKSNDEIFDDDWIEALNACKGRNVIISNLRISEDCLNSFLEFIKGTITDPVEMPETLKFENCEIPFSLKKDVYYISTHFDIMFDSISTKFY
ncbi:hypothetical protein ENUP19_0247G0022 [Entamoeba nuttalli]|uniref:Protein kinase domain containing protein n=2 Tax=Entamoeba nuttalli TaxID=412467 RepID=K2H001_ENTNP|nr:protein kinase domain containing protein [Entamoeba nuttalli P19]EKE40773.1 protein kinase domain containing protein [Entamoeba nuttalli P19]|eukprot:XP_008856891.1 protein kinase domain containing protein [Entamoeba nuttalli P19]